MMGMQIEAVLHNTCIIIITVHKKKNKQISIKAKKNVWLIILAHSY